MRTTIVWAFLLMLGATCVKAQVSDIVKSDSITNPLQKANFGRITFMPGIIPIETYKESDFLQTFTYNEDADLDIRVFMDNSLTNYLHRLAPEMSVDSLLQNGNYQFRFYVDGKQVYEENLNKGAGLPVNKNTKTTLRVPFLSTTHEDSWGRSLWSRFLMHGGQEALTTGTHTLKVEMGTYLLATELKKGPLIASGTLQLIIPKIEVDASLIAVQPIAANSGWPASTATYDTTILRALNEQIGAKRFKDITSIVVIKDGKLLIEEYFHGTGRDSLQDTRSVGKSFTSAMMGIAIKDGYIKSELQPLRDFYHLQTFANYSVAKENIMLERLLTMSAPFQGNDDDNNSPGNEENMYPTGNWVKFALDLPLDSARVQQRQWAYFTAGVVILGDVLHQSIPGGLEKYADKKLFSPLGITHYQWQYTPQHVVSTAGGLGLRSLDLAKFGQLYKNKGVWKGQQIIPASWIAKSFTHQLEIPNKVNEYYGYLFWNKTYTVKGKAYETFYSSGNGGNKIFVFKDQPLVIIITATAYGMPYAHPQVDKIMQQYLLPALMP